MKNIPKIRLLAFSIIVLGLISIVLWSSEHKKENGPIDKNLPETELITK